MPGRSLMVIGGSGFFGKSILDAYARGLLARWSIDRIIVVARAADRLRREHPELLDDTVVLTNADVGTVDTLPRADYVIHAASSTDARRYAEFPLEERGNILRAIDNYCRVAREVHRDARIVYTSSGAVYGQQPADLALLDEDFTPGTTVDLAPYKRDYAEAKRLAEQRIADLGRDGLRVTVARCFAFVGRYLPRDQHFAIGNFLADGLAGRPIKVKARKAVYRSYMAADDLVCWLMTMADAANCDCPVYNVGSEEALTMSEVAHRVAARFGVSVESFPFDSVEVDRYVPSIAKARGALRLEPPATLEEAVAAVATRIEAAERDAGLSSCDMRNIC